MDLEEFENYRLGKELPNDDELKTLYAKLAKHLNYSVPDQQKYKDLMNRILVKAMGVAPVVAAPPPIAVAAPKPAAVPLLVKQPVLPQNRVRNVNAELKGTPLIVTAPARI